MDDSRLDHGAGHCHEHCDDAGNHAAARRSRIVHPMQGEHEKGSRKQIGDLDEVQPHHLPPFRVLNILIMRTVIRNPLTTLVMEANKAMAPRRVMYGGWSSPVITIEPTTAMAEMEFVSDISGVCSNRDTRLITPRPMKVASMNTNSVCMKSAPGSGAVLESLAKTAAGVAAIQAAKLVMRMLVRIIRSLSDIRAIAYFSSSLS